MKKITKMLLALFLSVLLILVTVTPVQAASYPSVFFFSDEDFSNLVVSMQVSKSTTTMIYMKWYPAFKNEGYEMKIYDENGYIVATASNTFYNSSTLSKQISVRWDTSDLPAGRYTVEVTKKFYSLYTWNAAPTTSKLYITLVEPCTSHSWDEGKVINQATCQQTGLVIYTCINCGEQNSVIVDKAPHAYGNTFPKTCTVCGAQFNENLYATYQGYRFTTGSDGNTRCYDSVGNPVINGFKCDGTYTYYFQADGTAMKDRLTYHPDGVHIIYFDPNGHEVFSNYAHISMSIAGSPVDDNCFFDMNGYMYVDVMTWDETGTYLLYANPYGRLECEGWFQFSNTVAWADGTPCTGIAGGYGYGQADCHLMRNQYVYDWQDRYCYMQGNGVALY